MTTCSKKIAQAVLLGVLATSTVAQAKQKQAPSNKISSGKHNTSQTSHRCSGIDPNNVTTANTKLEGCYGVSKKRMNDCGNASHACAGQQNNNKNPDDFMMVLKGNCKKIVGGLASPGCKKGCTPS